MNVDYNKFAKTFSQSRKSMKWQEIDYFLDNYFLLSPSQPSPLQEEGVEQKNVAILSPERGESRGIDLENQERIPWGIEMGISILDVGCGSGRLLSHIGHNYDISNINYTGIDLSSGMLEEAKKNFPDKEFFELNMTDLYKLEGKFDYIFFIASYHHLQFVDDRMNVLKKAKELLKPGGLIFMTNWALNSEINYEKYTDSIIEGSTNEFGSTDYNIYIGEYPRFYHCFNLSELEYLFKENGFEIIENREFENHRNYISIIKKV